MMKMTTTGQTRMTHATRQMTRRNDFMPKRRKVSFDAGWGKVSFITTRPPPHRCRHTFETVSIILQIERVCSSCKKHEVISRPMKILK